MSDKVSIIDPRTIQVMTHLADLQWSIPLLKWPGKFDTILDIGAYCGNVSALARILNPRAEIVAIEPNPLVFPLLCDNLKGLNIATHRLALGNGSTGKMSSNSRDIGNTFVPGDECESMTLGNIIKLTKFTDDKRLLIKLNCEGGESSIWEDDASVKVMAAAAVVIIECHGTTNIHRFHKLAKLLNVQPIELKTRHPRHQDYYFARDFLVKT
jgi:FkbM family methyltransferase